jgi:hypothetical protein
VQSLCQYDNSYNCLSEAGEDKSEQWGCCHVGCGEGEEGQSTIEKLLATYNNFCANIEQMKVLVEATVALSRTFISYYDHQTHLAHPPKKFIQLENFKIDEFINDFNSSYVEKHYNDQVDSSVSYEWATSSDRLVKSKYLFSHPDLILLVFMAVVHQATCESNLISIDFDFEPFSIENSSTFSYSSGGLLPFSAEMEGGKICGTLTLKVNYEFDEIKCVHNERVNGLAPLDHNTLNTILQCMQCSYNVLKSDRQQRNSSSIHCLRFPCIIFL